MGEKIHGLNESVLLSMMVRLGLSEDDVEYGEDVLQGINSAIVALTQVGVGPPKGFRVTDETATWSDFTGNIFLLDVVKDYVYLKTKLVFDPPNGGALEAYNKVADEALWRCKLTVEQLMAT